MGAAAAALTGCPTYSEEARRGPADQAEGERGEDLEREARAAQGDAEEAPSPAPAGEPEAEPEPERSADPNAPIMHRENAGEPDDSGWYAATSTNGGYSVEVPGAFDDYELAPNPDQVMHLVTAEHDGVRYLVQCSMGGESPRELLASFEAQLPQLGDIQQQRRVSQAGGEGLEFRLSADGSTISIRTLALEHALCQLMVEAQQTPYPERDGARFMESFGLVDG